MVPLACVLAYLHPAHFAWAPPELSAWFRCRGGMALAGCQPAQWTVIYRRALICVITGDGGAGRS